MKSFLLLQAVLVWTIASANLNLEFCTHLFQGKDFPGNDILVLQRKTPEHCSTACTNYEDCECFTFNKKTELCYLKSYTMLPSPSEINIVTGVVSGYTLKDCHPDNMCRSECSDLILDGYDFPGSEFASTIQPDADRCQLVCINHLRCKTFTFISGTHPDKDMRFKCSLKSPDTHVPGEIVKKDHYHSGYALRSVGIHKNCSDEVYDNLDFLGNDQREVTMESYEECRNVCTADSLCQFWTFGKPEHENEALRNHCFLKNVMALPTPPVIRNQVDAVSGFSQKKFIDDESEETTQNKEVQQVKE